MCRIARFVGFVLLLTGPAGCDAPLAAPPQSPATTASPPPPPPPSAAVSEAPVAAAGDPPAVEPPVSPVVEAPAATAAQEPPPQAPQAAQPPIKLSAGVAAPQSLPEGTQIGVSVDYRVSGRINTSSRYVLVIESKGKEVEFEVKLSPPGGTLQGFCPASVRPEDQPFRARIDEQRSANARDKVSNTVNLQTSY